MRVLAAFGLLIVFALPPGVAGQAPAGCNPVGSMQFICGQEAPEDLVLVPGSDWVIASVFAGKGGIRLISVREKTTSIGYPTSTSKDRLDTKTYDSCPG